MEKTTSSLLFADTLQQLTYDLVRYSAMCDRVCTEQLDITGAQGYTLLAIPDRESISMNDLSVKMKLASSTMTRGRMVLLNMSKPDSQTVIFREKLYRSLPPSLVLYLLGGCRPVLMEELVNKAGFISVKRTYIAGKAPSEIVVAEKSC